MHTLKRLGLLAIGAALFVFAPALHARPAQVSVHIGIGAEPACPYGYYETYPFDCAPYGYYGPEWFPSGVFIGAGPWYHGHGRFYGYVDHRYDYRRGYRGPYPRRGERREERHEEFRGRARHDSYGREVHRWNRR